MTDEKKEGALRALGIDPGLGTLGYGVVSQYGGGLACECYGVIKTPPGLTLASRLSLLYDELKAVAEKYPPDMVAVEKLFFGRNVTTAEMVWQARGVVLLMAAQLGFEPYEVKPSEVKLAVCGYGGAEKGQVQGMVAHLLGLAKNPSPDDAADALAIAIAGLALHSYDRNILRGY
ncbi:MAG: crossover junction endodeoxyribonuclease RuvC [Synergistaceae bacterium]|nr:crossover junction endodeoxyribonuclease RuvC [Synergistaceae bacterium]